MSYFASYASSLLSVVFTVFLVGTLGYLLGRIEIRGISLGTAGVLLVALVYGIFLNHFSEIQIGGNQIILYSDQIKSSFSLISNLGTAFFVSAVGLIAGPKFFHLFNRKTVRYLLLGALIIAIGALTTILLVLLDPNLDPAMAVGLMTGALTSTPGLSAAKESAENVDLVTAGYGISYIFGVLGVVLFVQLIPRILHANIQEERKKFVAANSVTIPESSRKLCQVEPLGFFPIMLTVTLGCILGSFKVPGTSFSLGTSGGALIAGLLVGHFGHFGPLDCHIPKTTLNCVRELGLVLFLIGAGVPSGVNFVRNVRLIYFLYGVLMTLLPMLIGFIIAKALKMSIFNNLGAITGGMTSTPALGALIAVAGTDEVASAYAAVYPVALVCVVLASKLILLLF